jgi:hypothetical protein
MTKHGEKHYLLASPIALVGLSAPNIDGGAETLQSEPAEDESTDTLHNELTHTSVVLLLVLCAVLVSRLYKKGK